MNPNAKEFVPAHIMKKRQDEAVGSLAKQMNDVDLDESKKVGETNGETSCVGQQSSTRTTDDDKTQSQPSPGGEASDSRGSSNKGSAEPQSQKAQHNSSNQNNGRSKDNQESNAQHDEDDRYLLKAGENYCEFNGEQFIIPGDDDEYENDNENDNENPGSDNSNPGYDFGNAEDNEDEDVINAYDAFLSALP